MGVTTPLDPPGGTAACRPLGRGAAPSQTLPRQGGSPTPAPDPEAVGSGMKQRQKSKRLSVRMSPDEWASLKEHAEASGMVMSDFVRALVGARIGVSAGKENKKEHRKKNKKEYREKDEKKCREVAAQIARVGNNINQLAKWANTYKSAADGAQAIRLFAAALNELKRISAMVKGE